MWQIRTRRLQTHFTPEQTEASCSDSQAQGTYCLHSEHKLWLITAPQARPEMSPEPNWLICPTPPLATLSSVWAQKWSPDGQKCWAPTAPWTAKFSHGRGPKCCESCSDHSLAGSSVGGVWKLVFLCFSKSSTGQKGLSGFSKGPMGLPTKFKASKAHLKWSSLIKILQDIWKC